ncbi:type 1 glutamine amidotransferase domain-containing protein [Chryseolinea lacunae]|uniref:Type 1 glutamine amidotransferase domain-containing protein n=1 Tax=Chryseolinea lacunae TaxID=2801331 RepID=A0ABS1KSD8_9BACT|nr:type 1 glutamine amidotransferase domain-containing protein [Chryseolinea lacunae]MBL0742344.1 type 1 glutamine amidotransferase domain-containing protein [Chryseolinea lacunae]
MTNPSSNTPGKLLLTALLTAVSFLSYSQSRKILIVSTNVDSVGNHVSGTFLKEIAYPFKYFIDKGYAVDVLTPKGGKAAIYDNGNVPDDLQQIQKSEAFSTKINATLSPVQVNVKDYVAIFYPGGHGQYFDVMNDERISVIAAKIYENGGVVGTAGHGAASLINVQLSNGSYLVAGKTMTCFPHWAELKFMNISNYGKLLPFDMEDVLARRGAILNVCSAENRDNNSLTLVADAKNKIVTGAFANSAPWVAEQMDLLIKENKKRS